MLDKATGFRKDFFAIKRLQSAPVIGGEPALDLFVPCCFHLQQRCLMQGLQYFDPEISIQNENDGFTFTPRRKPQT